MNLYDTGLWMDDIKLAAEHVPELGELAGKTVLITGAYGLIASACTDMLIACNLSNEEKIEIYAAGRSIEKMRARFGAYFDREWFHFLKYDALKEIEDFPESCDYVIHAAGNAYPAMIVKEPVETMLANFDGMRRLLARAHGAGTRRLLYVSSSEIYGRKDDKSCDQDAGADDPVDLPVEIEKGTDRLIVIFGDRPVHAEYDRARKPELGHVEDLKDRGKEPVQAEILRAEGPDDDSTDQKGQHNRNDFADQTEYHIALCIFYPIQLHLFSSAPVS